MYLKVIDWQGCQTRWRVSANRLFAANASGCVVGYAVVDEQANRTLAKRPPLLYTHYGDGSPWGDNANSRTPRAVGGLASSLPWLRGRHNRPTVALRATKLVYSITSIHARGREYQLRDEAAEAALTYQRELYVCCRSYVQVPMICSESDDRPTVALHRRRSTDTSHSV